jgi:hypothetical protein
MLTDSDAYDITDNNFKIRGDVGITAPVGGEKLGCRFHAC